MKNLLAFLRFWDSNRLPDWEGLQRLWFYIYYICLLHFTYCFFSEEPCPEHSARQVLKKYLVMVLLKCPWNPPSTLEQTLGAQAVRSLTLTGHPLYTRQGGGSAVLSSLNGKKLSMLCPHGPAPGPRQPRPLQENPNPGSALPFWPC